MDALEKLLQEQIDRLAPILIEKFPEIARDDPQRIGRMAKEIVLEMGKIAAGSMSVSEAGRKGGLSTSPDKVKASRANGRKSNGPHKVTKEQI
jgi:hypothetical protein